MRDINRIPRFLAILQKYWMEHPDWRFTQLVENVCSKSNLMPFFIEDEEFLTLLKEFFEDKK